MTLIKVDDYEITEQEFCSELFTLCRDKGIEKPDHKTIEEAVNNLVEGFIVLKEARAKGVEVTEDEVEKELLDLMVGFDSPDQYNEFLEFLKTSPEIVEKHLQDKLIIRKFLNANHDMYCTCSEEKLRLFYEENIDSFRLKEVIRVSHILIKPEMGMEKAVQVRSNIKTPEDFSRVVGCCSDCPSCSQAGDLGYIQKGKMVPEFDRAAFSLDVNEISKPIATEYGFHIIMLTDKKKEITLPFDQVKDLLKKRLCKIENEIETIEMIQELKMKAAIFVSDDIWLYANE